MHSASDRRPIPPRGTAHWRFIAATSLALCSSAGMATATEQRIDDTAQQALAITLYNDNLALVKDQRQVALEQGENRLAWRNVSVKIRPETALLKAVSGPFDLTRLEQNFDFDLLTPTSLLKKYVGRAVQVIRANDAGERTAETATVLAVNEGLVLRYADRIETAVVGHFAFPDVPETLRDQPTLVLHLESGQSGTGNLELAYLTGGLSWKADYVADLAPDGQTMDLNGWVTLTNASGIAYRKAQVQLVAGAVNQVAQGRPSAFREDRNLMAIAREAPMPAEESLAEYHLYTLPRRTDILHQQTKQVALLSASKVPFVRELIVRGQPDAYQTQTGDGWTKLPVASTLTFVNRDGHLGIPLPKGVIRVYAKDRRDNAQFIGEDAIEHTPKNETVVLKLGESFDVTARRKQTDFKKLGRSGAYAFAFEAAFEMVLKNAKAEAVTVKVLETIPGDWEIDQESLPHTKETSNLAAWQVRLPAEGSATLTWRTRIRH